MYGETHNADDQMPGGSNNRVEIYNTEYTVWGQWTTTDMNSTAGANNTNWYGAQKVSSNSYRIWDKGCTS
jgi:hypothetical protein